MCMYEEDDFDEENNWHILRIIPTNESTSIYTNTKYGYTSILTHTQIHTHEEMDDIHTCPRHSHCHHLHHYNHCMTMVEYKGIG